MTDRLFLYGTLLPGLVRPPLAALVARLRPLGPATRANRAISKSASFPSTRKVARVVAASSSRLIGATLFLQIA